MDRFRIGAQPTLSLVWPTPGIEKKQKWSCSTCARDLTFHFRNWRPGCGTSNTGFCNAVAIATLGACDNHAKHAAGGRVFAMAVFARAEGSRRMFSRLGVPQFGIAGPLQRRPTSNDPRTPGGAAPLAALAPALGLPRKCREAEAKSNEPAEVQYIEPPLLE